MRLALIVCAVAASGCLRSGAFECTSDTQCTQSGAQGVCEAVGFCSFPDGVCPSGRRFGDVSGAYTNQCVGAAGSDGGVGSDASTGSDAAPPDAPALPDGLGCPVGYATLAGVPAHAYRRIGTATSWQNQVAACHADGANVHLAIPDDATELAAIVTLASTSTWVGVDDTATEGTFVTVLGAPATYLPWAVGQPDNSGPAGGSDCVLALSPSNTFDDRRCSNSAIAVCECEP